MKCLKCKSNEYTVRAASSAVKGAYCHACKLFMPKTKKEKGIEMTKEQQQSFYKQVGKALTASRQQRNITIAELARKSGEQYKTINSIESGSVCSLHHLVWMVQILGLDITKIITQRGEDNEQEIKRGASLDDII